MNKETKELTGDNCPHTRRIRFSSKGELAESANLRVQHYKNLKDADSAKLIKSEWIIN